MSETPNFSFDQIKSMTNHFGNELGGGACAVFFGGVWHHNNVAVKRYELKHHRHLFENEVKLLKKFKHHNIVKYYGFALARHHGFLVMGNGGTTLEKILTGPDYKPNLLEILEIVYQLVEGVEHINQAHGIVIADLKLDNILLDSKNTLRLCDFGGSCKIGYVAENFNRGYSAPEVVNKDKSKDTSDVYSIGAIILHLTTPHEKYGLGLVPKIDNELQTQWLKVQGKGKSHKIGGRKIELNKRERGQASTSEDSQDGIHISIRAQYELQKGNQVFDERLLNIWVDGSRNIARELIDLAIKCTKFKDNQRAKIKEVATRVSQLRDRLRAILQPD